LNPVGDGGERESLVYEHQPPREGIVPTPRRVIGESALKSAEKSYADDDCDDCCFDEVSLE
jgi:hypothetical protein